MNLASELDFAPARVHVDRRADGTIVLRSPLEITTPRAVGEWLVHWARHAPDRVFLAERAGDADREITYARALELVRRVGHALLKRGLATGRVAILSDNSVDQALLMLGAMHVGVAVAPISPSYSLLSKDFAKLKAIFELLSPGLVFASPPEKFGAALEAVKASGTCLDELVQDEPDDRVDEAFAKVTPDTVGKILFTSGSTGSPKGVLNTHRMMTASQEGLAAGWPFLNSRPPLLVDWLPWSHTFGGNHNFNLVLRNGGTLFVDTGKPAPGLIDTTVGNLARISPTLYFNVPRGFDLLLPFLERDAALRKSFFSRLDVIFYAAAALPQNLWERLEKVALLEGKENLAMLSAWGSTETSPLATQVHFHIERAGVIGLPIAGCELKLAPFGKQYEARVRGPNVTPGYLDRADLTRDAFDEEGFYKTGDAIKLADESHPERGVVFDGRIAEDFKLTTGTWVHVGAVRSKLIAAGDPFIQDAVITGHDRDEVGALVVLTAAAQKEPATVVRQKLAAALRTLASQPGGSSTCPRRLMVLTEALSLDEGEITDKGYVNQRRVLERRSALVRELYAAFPLDHEGVSGLH